MPLLHSCRRFLKPNSLLTSGNFKCQMDGKLNRARFNGAWSCIYIYILCIFSGDIVYEDIRLQFISYIAPWPVQVGSFYSYSVNHVHIDS